MLEGKYSGIALAELRLLPTLCDRIMRTQRETETARRALSPIHGLIAELAPSVAAAG